MAAAVSGLVTVLRLTAFNLFGASAISGPPFPGGESDIDVPFQAQFLGVQQVFYLAATKGMSTAPGDTPADIYIPGKASASINFGTAQFAGIDPLSAASTALSQGAPVITVAGTTVVQGSSALSSKSSTTGQIILTDPDGELDWLTGLSFDGATLEILQGPDGSRLADFTKAAAFTTSGLTWDANQKTIALRDLSWLLGTADLHGQRYGGAGGLDGDALLATAIKPYLVGQATNFSPPRINAALEIFQCSFTPVQAVLAVRDKGAPLIPAAVPDYPTYAALAAALAALVVPGGHYATCLAQGLIGIGDTPSGTITCDAQGDNTLIGGAGYASTRADIARRIAVGYGNLKLTTAQLDAASFTALNTAQPAPCGWFFNQEMTKGQALDLVLEGSLGQWLGTIDGLLSVEMLDEPSAVADFTISVGDASGDLVAIGSPAMQSTGSPRQATFLGYQKNYTIQTPDQLDGIVTPDNVALFGAPTLQVGSRNSQLVRATPTVPVISIDSGFVNKVDAQTESNRQQRVMGKQRARYLVKVNAAPYAKAIGLTAAVHGWTNDRGVARYGMGSSKNFRVIGVDVSGANVVTYTLWG